MNLREETLSSEQVYSGNFLQVREDGVRLPNGKQAKREYIQHPGAAAILVLSAQNELLLVRQYRHALREVFLEIPAGKIDAGETAAQTAQRELGEETGFCASDWLFLGTSAACIGYSDEQIHYFLARNLTAGKPNLDEGELLESFWLPLDEVRRLSLCGEISDSKTLVGLYWLDAFLRGEWHERRG